MEHEQPISPIATPAEILAVYTTILRTGKPSEQLKAGENLSKYLPMETLLRPEEDRKAEQDIVAMIERITREEMEALPHADP